MLTNSIPYLAPFTPRNASSALSLSSFPLSVPLSHSSNETESQVANVENCDARDVDI